MILDVLLLTLPPWVLPMNTSVDRSKPIRKDQQMLLTFERNAIGGQYIDDISITLGSPRKYVWTFASGVSDTVSYTSHNCPCATHPGPGASAFVGNDYYCESGNSGA